MAASTSIKLDDGLKERIAKIAERKSRSANSVMNEAIKLYAVREETEEEFREEARKAVRDYRETGLHVTHEEAMEWLERRSRGENVPAPKAHR
jgi:predicted transcriptional regulator